MELKIDRISESDFEALVALFKEFATFAEAPDKMVNSVEQMRLEKDYIQGFTLKNERGEIVAYTTFFFTYHTWVGKSLYMDDLYVTELYRGQGLGTRLINKIIAFARAENCNRLRWQVSTWNVSAIGFYKSLGAKIDKVEMNCDLVLKNRK